MSFSLPNRPKRKAGGRGGGGGGDDPRKQRKTGPGKQPAAATIARPLPSSFDGYKEAGDNLPAPFDRMTVPAQDDPAEVRLHDLKKQAVVAYGSGDEFTARGSFNSSFVQLYTSTCATSPTISLTVRSLRTAARWAIDFDLHEMSEVTATVFNVITASPGSIAADKSEHDVHATALKQAVEAAQPSADLETADPPQPVTPGKYLRIVVKRRQFNVDNDRTDYAMYSDERVDWTPSEAEAKDSHDSFQPYRPKQAALGHKLQDTLNHLACTPTVQIFLAQVDRDVELHAKILQHITRSGCDDKFRPDWYWSRHKLYVTRDENDGASPSDAKWFQQFYDKNHLVKQKPHYPERQPWLQIATQDGSPKYAPVWLKTKTRFSGPGEYRSTYIPASLWEIEATAVMYQTQFTNAQTYFAAFQLRRDEVLIKIKLRGSDAEVRTTHGQLQVVPAAGTKIKVRVRTGDLDKPQVTSDDDTVFSGITAEKRERGWDVMLVCETPVGWDPKSLTEAMKKGTAVVLEADYENHQDYMGLQSIEMAAFRTGLDRIKGPNTTNDRVEWKVSAHTGGAHVPQLSRDFYGDWLAEKSDGNGVFVSNEDAAIDSLVTDILYTELNVEQRQAYLLALRGSPKAQLGIEGCPGTGKSRTLSNIAIAFLAMGYSVCLGAQSNNGVDAVFEKIAKATTVHHEVDSDLLVRFGASTIDRKLISSLLSAWKESGDMETPLNIESSIANVNIPYTAAYKTAKFIHENPQDELSKNWRRYALADEQKVAAFGYGPARRPAGASSARSMVRDKLIDKVLGNPRLIGATCAAMQRKDIAEWAEGLNLSFDVLIFDEASQSTEAAFMTAAMADINKKLGLVILGGDTKQLPPVIQSTFENPFAAVLEMSPLERMIKANHDAAVVNLLRNYRSHSDIVRLASQLFYNGRMVAGRKDGDTDNMPLGPMKTPLKDVVKGLYKIQEGCSVSNQLYVPAKADFRPYNGRIWVVDVPGFSKKAPESHSTFNENGIRVSCRLAGELAKKIGSDNVEIITMYSYELKLFRESKFLPKGVEVKTVDSFQGLEDVAIVLHCSAAFAERPNPLGHISNVRRLNVALTRAKELMFIVGNFSFWEDRILKVAGKPNDSSGGRKFHMEVNEPFYRLLTEVRRAKMVAPLSQEVLNSLPDVYIKRGKLCQDFKKTAAIFGGKEFKHVKDRESL